MHQIFQHVRNDIINIKLVRYIALSAVVTLVIGMVACGSPAENPVAESSTGSSGTTVGKLSANNASGEDLKVAFETAGIPNAEQWAHEVEEYRPYPEDDPEFAKLRQDLAKYNPGPGVLDQIVGQLTLP